MGTTTGFFSSRLMEVTHGMNDLKTSYFPSWEALDNNNPTTLPSQQFQSALSEKQRVQQNFVADPRKDCSRWGKTIRFDVSLVCFEDSEEIEYGRDVVCGSETWNSPSVHIQ